MSKVEVSGRAEAPVAVTFATFADIAGAARFVRGIEAIEMLDDGPLGVGSRFRETRRIHGRTGTEEMTVTAFDPPHGFVLEAAAHGARYRTVYRFEPEGTGTRVRRSFEAGAVGLVARVLSVLLGWMAGSVRTMIEADLADTIAEAERRARAAS